MRSEKCDHNVVIRSDAGGVQLLVPPKRATTKADAERSADGAGRAELFDFVAAESRVG